ncbi:MAG TPA: xanthine dehydrogenase family protein molybdopterin-binding subunit [Thermoanaerobaculia bacterium]|jgi:isoquinoline 1-oxidoreductase beta subunit
MSVFHVSRRTFTQLSAAAAAGLLLGVAPAVDPKKKSEPASHELGTFVQVGTDGGVTIWVTKSDMGQGIRTSLPMIVAEELDADWKRVKIRQAYFHPKFGRMGTGGSGSIRSMWTPLRQAGASARAMLVSAAAAKLGVEPASLTVAKGVISHADGRKVTFGEVAEAAAKIEVPKDVPLKDPKNFTIIGKVTPRLDERDIVTGQAGYGADVKLPGMLYAVVARAPVFGGKVVSFDDTKAKAIPGVKHVVKVDASGTELPWNGVAVVATSTWVAMQGRDALDVKWDDGEIASESTATLWKQFADSIDKATPVQTTGDVDAALAAAAKTVEATYELPYLAHAAMEPLTATAHVKPDGTIEVWAPTQFPNWATGVIGQAYGIKQEEAHDKIRVNVTMLGGGFGRKANPDFVFEAVQISKAVGAPVKVQWTREDDMRHDFYRPASYHRVTGGLDADGKLVAWRHRIAAPSIESYFTPKSEKPHESEVGGIEDTPYVVPNFRIDFALAKSGVPRGWWRSVEHSITGFVVNSFMDEAARAAGKDPIEFQLAMLPAGRKAGPPEGPGKDYPMESDRLRRVIELVREKSTWGAKLPEGVGRGFGAHWSFLSYSAHVAEVSVEDGTPRVHRIVCAIDCGIAVNPDGIRAQVEGAIVYGLTAALQGEITIDAGRVQQSNFHDYPLLNITQMPKVEVHIVPSAALPTGTGEPGLPPAAAAVANAIFDATGKRVRRLPFGTIG